MSQDREREQGGTYKYKLGFAKLMHAEPLSHTSATVGCDTSATSNDVSLSSSTVGMLAFTLCQFIHNIYIKWIVLSSRTIV